MAGILIVCNRIVMDFPQKLCYDTNQQSRRHACERFPAYERLRSGKTFAAGREDAEIRLFPQTAGTADFAWTIGGCTGFDGGMEAGPAGGGA